MTASAFKPQASITATACRNATGFRTASTNAARGNCGAGATAVRSGNAAVLTDIASHPAAPIAAAGFPAVRSSVASAVAAAPQKARTSAEQAWIVPVAPRATGAVNAKRSSWSLTCPAHKPDVTTAAPAPAAQVACRAAAAPVRAGSYAKKPARNVGKDSNAQPIKAASRSRPLIAAMPNGADPASVACPKAGARNYPRGRNHRLP